MAKAKKKPTPAPVPAPAPVQVQEERYSKRAILLAEPYKFSSALVNALLEDDKTYTLAEVDDLLERYRKGKVK